MSLSAGASGLIDVFNVAERICSWSALTEVSDWGMNGNEQSSGRINTTFFCSTSHRHHHFFSSAFSWSLKNYSAPDNRTSTPFNNSHSFLQWPPFHHLHLWMISLLHFSSIHIQSRENKQPEVSCNNRSIFW